MAGKSAANLCQGKDSFERMNFLYQAGTLMSTTNPTLSCYYGKLCRAVAKKAVLRMEPAIKRTICKRCGYILLAGSSAELRIDASNPKLCELECAQCGAVRRFTVNEKYESWPDNPRSVQQHLNLDGSRLPPMAKRPPPPPATTGGASNGQSAGKRSRKCADSKVAAVSEADSAVVSAQAAT